MIKLTIAVLQPPNRPMDKRNRRMSLYIAYYELGTVERRGITSFRTVIGQSKIPLAPKLLAILNPMLRTLLFLRLFFSLYEFII